jgi:hypothetical protein
VLENRLLLSVTMADYEQLMLYYINRARVDPVAEAARFGIGLNDGLDPGTITPDPKQPLIPNQVLRDVAAGHAADMLARDYFAHENPEGQRATDRAQAAGYPTSYVGENIAWEGRTDALDRDAQPAIQHKALFLSPPHRTNILHEFYQDAGVGLEFGRFTESGTTYNAAMVAQNFGRRNADKHLVGVVYDDTNDNGAYDLDEGLANVTVTVGGRNTTTDGNGGWFLQVSPGTHEVTTSGLGFLGNATSSVTVDDQNIQLDFISGLPWGIVNFVHAEPIEAKDDRYFAAAGKTLIVAAGEGVLANERDASPKDLTAHLEDEPLHGDLTFNPDGSFSYDPGSTFQGLDTFTYWASDGEKQSIPATVTLVVAEPLGTVDYRHLQPATSGGDLWYRWTTARSGSLTIDAANAPGGTLTLHDSSLDVITSSTDPLNDPRIDLPINVGETLYVSLSGVGEGVELRIGNLVSFSGTEVQVAGTEAVDHFEFAPTGSYLVTINGIEYHFDDSLYETIVFNGGAGDDTATLTGGPDAETARFFPDHGTFGENGFLVSVNGVTTITAHGGGGTDSAFMYDSPGDDEFFSFKGYGKLSGEGFVLETFDFALNYGYATTKEGGTDIARLEDTPGSDKFKLDWPKSGQFFGKMYGGGQYYNRAKNFERIEAVMTDGKNQVRLFDSESDDTFYGQKDESRMTGLGFDVTVRGYDSLVAYASQGNDLAYLEDSDDDDTVRARPHKVLLWGGDDEAPTYEIAARKFDAYRIEATHAGYDKAKLHDTVFDDHADASGNSAKLSRNRDEMDLLYETVAFEWVRLYGTPNDDQIQNRNTLKKEDPTDFELVFDPAQWEEIP